MVCVLSRHAVSFDASTPLGPGGALGTALGQVVPDMKENSSKDPLAAPPPPPESTTLGAPDTLTRAHNVGQGLKVVGDTRGDGILGNSLFQGGLSLNP